MASEQQLRCIHPDVLPDWIPRSRLHRPDGYWLIPDESSGRLVALEVELSQKRYEQYEVTRNFYNRENSISGVLWVVGVKSLASKILVRFQESGFRFRNIHSFVALDDFLNHGWDSEIFLGARTGKKSENF